MIKLLRLALLLSLLLTSIGLGAARGTVELAGQVVICTGQGIVIRNIPGAPSTKMAHICPDMSLSFLNNVANDLGISVPEYRVSQLSPYPSIAIIYSQGGPTAAARDPPLI